MADQGAIGGPNGGTATAKWSLQFSFMWPNNATDPMRAFGVGEVTSIVPWNDWLVDTLPDARLHGSGYITGTISNGGAYPYVNLLTRMGRWLGGTRADVNGVYRFDGLDITYTDYTVIVWDATNTNNLGRLDQLTPYSY